MKKMISIFLRLLLAALGIGYIVWTLSWTDQVILPQGFILGVGKTTAATAPRAKRGKGTQIMGLSDAEGLPLAVHTCSASPHEVTRVDDTLDACVLDALPPIVIGDKAYDSDKLDEQLAEERDVQRATGLATQAKPSATGHAGRPNAPPLQTPLEDRTAVRLAAKLPAAGGSL